MAGRSVIGKLAVKVFPDLSDFKAQLKAELERINPKLEVKVDLKFDETKFKAEAVAAALEAAKAASKVAEVHLQADLDAKKVFAESQALAKSISRDVTFPLKPKLETSKLNIEKYIATQFGTPEIDFKFGIDHASLEKTKLEIKFAAREAAVTVPVKTDKNSFRGFISDAAGLGVKAASAIGNAIGEVATQTWDAFANEGQAAFKKVNEQISKFGSYLSNVQQVASLLGVSLLVVFGGALISAAIGGITLAIGGLEAALLGIPAAISVVSVGAGALLVSLNGVQDAIVAGWKGSKGYEDALKKLAPAAQTAVTSIVGMKDAVKGMGKEIQQSFFSGFADDLKSLGNTYIPIARQGLDNMAGSLGRLVGKFTKWASTQDAIERTKSIFDQTSRVIDHLAKGVDPLADAFSRLTDDALPFLQQGAYYATKLATQFDKWVKSAESSGELDDMFRNLGKLIDALVEPATRLAAGIAKVFAQKDSGKALDDLKDSLDEIVDNVLPYLPGFVKDFDKVVKSIAKLSEYTAPLAQVMHWLTDLASWTIGEYWGSSILLIYGMGKAIDDLVNNVKAFPGAVKNLVVATTLIGNSMVEGLVNGVKQNLSIAASLGSIIWNAINKGLGGIPAKVLGFGLTLPQKLWSGIKQNLSLASSGGTALKNAVVNGIKALPGLIYNYAIGIPGRILSGILSRISSATSGGSRVKNAVVNAARNGLSSAMSGIGQAAVQGLVNGLYGMARYVSQAASYLASLIPKGVAGLLGIHSPSRVMREYGRYTGQGLVLGIQDSYSSVADAANVLGGLVTGSYASGTVDAAVLHEIQGSIDSQPIEVTLVADGQKIAKVVTKGNKKNARR